MQQIAEHETTNGNGDLCGPSVAGTSRDVSELPAQSAVADIVYKVLVGIPICGSTHPKAYHDRMIMWQHLGGREAEDFYEKRSPRFVFGLGAIGNILTPFAREKLAESALAVGAEYLFMVDDDMLAPVDLFYKLQASGKDIIAPLAFTRNPDHKSVCYETKEGFDQSSRTRYGFTKFVGNYPRNTLFECDAVGFGAVLIRTEVFRKTPKPWFFGMSETGEDITLCIKAKRAGFGVWMDSRIKLGHLSDPIVVTEEYSDQWNKLSPDQREKQYGTFTKYSSMDTPLFK